MPAGPDDSTTEDADSGREVPDSSTDDSGTDETATDDQSARNEHPATDASDESAHTDEAEESHDTPFADDGDTNRVAGEAADAHDDEQWRFSLDDVADERDNEGNVAGSLIPKGPVEAQDIDLENAVFVVVGVVLVGVLIASLVFGF